MQCNKAQKRQNITIMKNSKKNQAAFIETMQQELNKLCAVPFISDTLQFDLETKFGPLWLRVDNDNYTCYSVYGRFIEPQRVTADINFNSFSGKWNFHKSGDVGSVVQEIVQTIKTVL